MPVAGMIRLATWTVQEVDLSPALTVMVADPGATAVTLPAGSTVAISALSVLQTTALSVASAGFTVATSWVWSPSVISSVVLSRETEETGTVTLTVQEADLSPALAVMVALPPPTAFTFPFSTVATSASVVLQVTVLLVASSGFTVADKVASAPLTSSSKLLSRVTDDTSMIFLDTATEQEALLSPALAVMVAVPSATAFTLPFSTVATLVSEELQVTFLSVASLGETMAVS